VAICSRCGGRGCCRAAREGGRALCLARTPLKVGATTPHRGPANAALLPMPHPHEEAPPSVVFSPYSGSPLLQAWHACTDIATHFDAVLRGCDWAVAGDSLVLLPGRVHHCTLGGPQPFFVLRGQNMEPYRGLPHRHYYKKRVCVCSLGRTWCLGRLAVLLCPLVFFRREAAW
jgi:hypothetical protein